MIFYIYCITNKINGKNYIGQRKCPTNKTPETDKYMGSGSRLKLAKKKYGLENFSKEILAITETKENVNVLEKVFIKLYRDEGKAEYNLSAGGDGGIASGELNPFYGKHHSEKTKKLLSKKCANYGSKNGFYGKHHSAETIEKNRKYHTGRILSDSVKIRMSESQKGRKHSEETKRKISDGNKGKFVSEETKRKISQSKKGCVPWNKGLKVKKNQDGVSKII